MPPSKSVSVDLDKKRKLRYTLRTIYRFKEETGKDILSKGVLEGLTFDDTVTLLWLGIADEDPNITKDELIDRVEFHQWAAAMRGLTSAWGLEGPAEEVAEGPKADASPLPPT